MRFQLVILFICSGLLTVNYSLKSESFTGYEGKHFIIGFMQNEITDFQIAKVLQLYLTSSYPGEAKVNIPGEGEKIYEIIPNKIIKIFVNPDLEVIEEEQIVKKTIEINSNVPILVYVFNSKETTSHCYTAIPTERWGYEYVVMSYPNDQYLASFYHYGGIDSSYLIPRKSEFMVLAKEDETTITIIPKALTNNKRPQNYAFNITLNKNECYLIQSYDYQISQGDLTGSIIRSDKPIGVISGHVRTAVPQFMDYIFESKDHLAVMLPPTNAWGREFYSVPYGFHDGGDLFRITSIEEGTIVNIVNVDTTMILNLSGNGDFKQLTGINKPTVWRANKPIQIGQYMMRIGGDDDNLFYDPSLVILPPAEQFVSKMIFQTVGNENVNPYQYDKFQVSLAISKKALESIRFDNKPLINFDGNIFNQKYPFSDYYYSNFQIDEGKHLITCDSGNFSGITYGSGRADAYALTLGSSLSNQFEFDTIPPNLTINEYCGRLSGTIFENNDSLNSGLFFVVMTTESYNYDFNLDKNITDSTYIVNFTAEPIDKLKDGLLVIEFRDKNGNGSKYEFEYQGIEILIPDSINFDVVQKGTIKCIDTLILSLDNIPIQIDSIKLSDDSDSRISISSSTFNDIQLHQGDSLKLTLCFDPGQDFTKLNEKLYIYYDCERYDSIYVTGFVMFPELTTIGYDFGEVCLGDSASGIIRIINNGNVDNIINSITDLLPSYVFEIDTFNIFPRLLQTNDTLNLIVKFKPDNTVYFEKRIKANNSLSIPNEILITGTGIAPLVHSIEINWGKRRIGSQNDTVVFLKNMGDCDAKLRFNGFDGYEIPFYGDEIKSLNKSLKSNDSIEIITSFKPDLEGQLKLKAFISVLSIGHSDVIIDMKGEGIIPVVEPMIIDFGEVKLDKTKDTSEIVIFNSGSDKLYINFKEFLGDKNSFIINDGVLDIIKNQTIDIANGIRSKIKFIPQKLGLNELYVIFEHDANPAFAITDTFFILRGIGIPADTFQTSINFDFNVNPLPCNENIINFEVINTGNRNLTIDSISFKANYYKPSITNLNLFPKNLNTSNKISIEAVITPYRGTKDTIFIIVHYNDSLSSISQPIFIEPGPSSIQIDKIDTKNFYIGTEDSLIISGKFPYASDIPVNLNFEINVDQRFLYLLSQFVNLKIITNNDTILIPMELNQSRFKITGNTLYNFPVDNNTIWIINLNLLTLLSDERTTEIKVVVNSELCYNSSEEVFTSNFLGVCLFDIRSVKISPNFDTQITPNPVDDELCIKINLFDKTSLTLNIYDEYGKKIELTKNLFLKKGLHYLIFEVSSLTSGVYILSIKAETGVENKIFIIKK